MSSDPGTELALRHTALFTAPFTAVWAWGRQTCTLNRGPQVWACGTESWRGESARRGWGVGSWLWPPARQEAGPAWSGREPPGVGVVPGGDVGAPGGCGRRCSGAAWASAPAETSRTHKVLCAAPGAGGRAVLWKGPWQSRGPGGGLQRRQAWDPQVGQVGGLLAPEDKGG